MKSKQLKRLWSLALLLMLMCLPEMAWAETGVWTYKGTHYGICAVNNNTSIQYIGMGNKSGWGDNSILYREDLGWGSKGTEFGGKTTKENEKFIAICYFSQDNTIPAYTKLVRTSTFSLAMASNRYQHGAGLYMFDTEYDATNTFLDAMPYQTESNAAPSNCIIKISEKTASTKYDASSKEIIYDNSNSANPTTFTKYISLAHVTCSYGSTNVAGTEWAGFLETFTDTYYYYVTITFDANGGTGSMDSQTIENSGTLTTNTFTHSNYLFTGWNTAADGSGTSYADAASFVATDTNKGPVTLYAQWTPTATITFNANGGSGTMNQQVITGSGTLSANTFTRTDYAFTGWNTAADGSGTPYVNQADFTATDSNKGPITLYAQWEPTVITITFDANGGSGTMAQQVITGSGTLTANAFTRENYLFTGWNTASDGSGTPYANKAAFTATDTNKGPITLYAQWVSAVTTITFNANDGEGTMNQQMITDSGTLTENAFTRTNYFFCEWNTAADGSGTSYSDKAAFTVTLQNRGNLTLYAQWEQVGVNVFEQTQFTTIGWKTQGVTETFNADGTVTLANQTATTNNNDYQYRLVDGIALTAGEEYTVTLEGKFDGTWQGTNNNVLSCKLGDEDHGETKNLNPVVDGKYHKISAKFVAGCESNGLLLQHGHFAGNVTWKKITISHVVTTVIFEANGGTGTMANQVITGSSALTTNAFSRAGYRFSGWNTTADGTGTAYADGGTFTPTEANKGNLTLYAQWQILVTDITFNANGGSGTMAQQHIEGAGTLNTCTLTRTNYVFTSWNTKADGSGTQYADGATLTVTEANKDSHTLYAQWTPAITFTFNANGGTGTMDQQMIAVSGTLSANTFTRNGYNFVCWNTAADGSGTTYADANSIAVTETNKGAVTLYAQWATGGAIAFVANGGEGAMSMQVVEGSNTLTTNTFTRNGYQFVGWRTEANGGTYYRNGSSVSLSAPLTLYAWWAPVGNTVWYYTATSQVNPYCNNLKNSKGKTLSFTNVFNSTTKEGVYVFNGTLTEFGEKAFEGRSGFTGELVIPNSVTTIGNYAFRGCTGFTGNMVIPNSVQSIGKVAFSDCTGFNGTLTLGSSLKTIGANAFYYCSGFTGNLSIPNSVTSIGSSAFNGCSGFKGTLTIGSSVQTIESFAFYKCLFTGSLVIPNSVTSIADNAFYNCTGFNGTLTLGSSVQTIGQYTFNECSGFTGSLTIPNSVTNIKYGAFYGCSGLKGTLTIGSSVQTIGSYAFSKCPFTGSLVIPNSVTSIERFAFSGSSFTGVTMKSIPNVDSYAFDNVKCDKILVLDDNSYVHTSSNSYFPSLASDPTYTRQMSNEWGTIVVPFAITYSQNNTGNYKLYKLTGTSSTSLNFAEYENGAEIAAGTPMVIRAVGTKTDGKYTVTLTAKDKSVSTGISDNAEVGGLTMKGTYAKKTNQTGMYFIAQDQFWKADAAITINPFRAWFEGTLPSGSNAKALNIVIEDDATSILQLENGELKTANSGKYLENGRVIIVKNGKKFNINGQEVK